MNSEQIYSFVMSVLAVYFSKKRQQRRRIWTRKIYVDRPLHGHGSCLLPDLMKDDPELFINFTRMSSQLFLQLLEMVHSRLERKKTKLRNPISPFERLALCLRFLAAGSSYAELSYNFRMGRSTVSLIVQETCQAIIEVLQPAYLMMPSQKEEWAAIAKGFEMKWNFPNCVGAIDGKHIAIKAPPNAGSTFINYKGFHSIVLMASCDANYCFTFIDVGNFGRISDGGVFANCFLGRKLREDDSFLPSNSALPNSNKIAPFVFVADEAFPLQTHLMRPFPGHFLEQEKRIYNYRLSRARRCIENAFGILSGRWRVLRTTMELVPENAAKITMACCCLHNFLMKSEMPFADRSYCPSGFADSLGDEGEVIEGRLRSEDALVPLEPISDGPSHSQMLPNAIRNMLKEYFNAEGAVSWQ